MSSKFVLSNSMAIYLTICALSMVMLLNTGLSNPLTPLFADALGASYFLVGASVSGFGVLRLLADIPSGSIINKLGSRLPLILGMLGAAVGAFICSTAVSVYILILGRALWGFGSALFYCSAYGLVTELFAGTKRGKALGTFQSTEFIGQLIGASLSGFIAKFIGFNMSFLICSILLTAGFVAATFIPSLKRIPTIHRETKKLFAFELLKNPSMILACSSSFLMQFKDQGIIYTVIPIYARNVLGIELAAVGFLVAARALGMIITTVSSGYIQDRIGVKPVLAAGFLLAGFAVFALSLSQSFDILFILMTLTGAATGMIMPTVPNIVATISTPEQRSGGMGIYRFFLDLGILAGPLVSATFASFGIIVPFYITSTLMFLNLVAIIILFKEERKR